MDQIEGETTQPIRLEVSIRGIPDGVFRLDNPTDKVTGLISGTQIARTVGRSPSSPNTDTSIYLQTELDEEKDKFGFLVTVDNGVVVFDITTKIGEKESKDFYAHDLIIRSIADLREQGVEINRFQTNWNRVEDEPERSVNYISFLKELGISTTSTADQIEVLLRNKTQDELSQAVFKTWTGKIAKEIGFGAIESLDAKTQKVTVMFKESERVDIVKTRS